MHLSTSTLGRAPLYCRSYKRKPVLASSKKSGTKAPGPVQEKHVDILPTGGWAKDPTKSWSGPDYIPL